MSEKEQSLKRREAQPIEVGEMKGKDNNASEKAILADSR
jgi:hypothetical protein